MPRNYEIQLLWLADISISRIGKVGQGRTLKQALSLSLSLGPLKVSQIISSLRSQKNRRGSSLSFIRILFWSTSSKRQQSKGLRDLLFIFLPDGKKMVRIKIIGLIRQRNKGQNQGQESVYSNIRDFLYTKIIFKLQRIIHYFKY